MIRLSDYIAQELVKHGIKHVFMVTGGGAMHLNDAFGRCKGLEVLCLHHEQSCATAAESYHRLTNRIAAVSVTTGPGGTNAITGVYGAYVDSLSMIVISGQVKYESTVPYAGLPLRQVGWQEVDIANMVKGITKYSVMVTDPSTIRYHLERALHLATSGRPGPVWLDIPINVQAAQIDPEKQRAYDPVEDAIDFKTKDLDAAARDLLDRMKRAKRPVIVASLGVRLSGELELFRELTAKWGIPVATAWNNHDLVPDDHPAYVGRPGFAGDRTGNFAVQNSDLMISMGCRQSILQIGYSWNTVAREAFKVMIDIDENEMKKHTFKADLAIHADVGAMLRAMNRIPYDGPTQDHRTWLDWCLKRRHKYPTVLPEYWNNKETVNPYCFMQSLFSKLADDEVVVCGDGTACMVTNQAAIIKKNTRVYHNAGSAPMGYDLPAAIGACYALGRKPLICLTGDGSIRFQQRRVPLDPPDSEGLFPRQPRGHQPGYGRSPSRHETDRLRVRHPIPPMPDSRRA